MFRPFLFSLLIVFLIVQIDGNDERAARCKRQIGGCILTPEATEGPYYWNSTIRQNITEGRSGIPLRLAITVIDTNNCTPLANVLVDLWHCDAVGIYSHYIAASQGNQSGGNDNQTFFRGLTLTNPNGIAVFDTIYPGWYSGRTTHIHIKVHVGVNITSNTSGTYSDGHVSHTGQLFFNDTLTDSVAMISPYSNHTIVRTRNSDDSIFASANGSVTIVSISQNSLANYTGTVTIGVNSSATPAAVGGDGMGPGPGQFGPNGSNMTMSPDGSSGASSSSYTLSSTTTLPVTTGISKASMVACGTWLYMIFLSFSLYIYIL